MLAAISTAQLTKKFRETKTLRRFETICGTLEALAALAFDTIIYIDVLEHIEDDREELNRAASHLRPGGHLIILSPAHQKLFTPCRYRTFPALQPLDATGDYAGKLAPRTNEISRFRRSAHLGRQLTIPSAIYALESPAPVLG